MNVAQLIAALHTQDQRRLVYVQGRSGQRLIARTIEGTPSLSILEITGEKTDTFPEPAPGLYETMLTAEAPVPQMKVLCVDKDPGEVLPELRDGMGVLGVGTLPAPSEAVTDESPIVSNEIPELDESTAPVVPHPSDTVAPKPVKLGRGKYIRKPKASA